MKIKTISLWQPHASLIALGEKPFETRSWATNHRGLLAIHASKRPPKVGDLDHRFEDALRDVMCRHGIRPQTEWPMGAILCVCNLGHVGRTSTEHFSLEDPPAWMNKRTKYAHLFGDFSDGRFMWGLEGVRRFREPIPAKGMQGLWTWDAPDDWEQRLERTAPISGGGC